MRRAWAALVGVGMLLLVTGLVTGVVGTPTSARAADSSAGSAVTVSGTAERVTFGQDGTTTPVETDHVTMSVSATQNLRGDQQVMVSWSGAHPTGGVVSNPNFGHDGAEQEYPFVLMECRGTPDTLTPETCWTQTSSERVQRTDSIAATPVWRADGYAKAADRAPVVDAPAAGSRPASCAPQRFERWVPMDAAGGTTYYGGGTGCLDHAPEGSDEDDGGVPSNTTYGLTGADGKGSTQFDIWTSAENATLGCSAQVACSLVAVPIVGISCDGYFTQAPDADSVPSATTQGRYQSACTATDRYQSGQSSDGVNFNMATSGELWWSASNWRNRLAVPLTFAVSSSVCDVVGSQAPLLAYGSILMSETAAQWQPKFCTDKSYQPFLHVQATDTEARSLVGSGAIQLGFSSDPPDGGFATPVAQAPIAVTGFAIAFNIDGADGQPLTSLKLDPRLLTKLLTESYTGDIQSLTPYDALADNPRTIYADPEFQALNPDAPTSVAGQVDPAAALISLSSDSDMMVALSSYILADPVAHKWLDGVPDPWGMRVNPSYQLDLADGQQTDEPHFALPVTSWPLLDSFVLDARGLNASPCMADMPYLAQIAHPVSLMHTIEQDLEFALPNNQTVCPTVDDPNNPALKVPKLQARQPVGKRFLIGIVPLTAVDRYGLHAAALLTTSDVGPSQKFSDTSGMTFVAPDDAGLAAAAALLAPDATGDTWQLPYDELATPAGAAAYPGTLPVYADAPTSGLDGADAARVAQFLDFAAGPGQTQGYGVGQLPPGALPLTAANGLGAQVAYTRCAALLVKAQTGTVPPLSGPCPVPAKASKPAKPKHSKAPATPSATPSTSPSVAAPPAPAPSVAPPAPSPSTVPVADAPPVKTVGQYSAFGRYGLPAVMLIGALLAILGLLLRWGTDLWAFARVAGPRIVPAARRGWVEVARRTVGRWRR